MTTVVNTDDPCESCGLPLGAGGKVLTANVLDLDPTDGSVLGESPCAWHEACAPLMVRNCIDEGWSS